MHPKLENAKQHIKDHQTAYILGTSVAVAGITCLIMRGVASQPIDSVIHGVAGPVIHGTRNKVVMSNVSYISANRQGPPSWVVRCLETGKIFTSQHQTALKMELRESDLSRHLNGVLDHVDGYHFERICLAA